MEEADLRCLEIEQNFTEISKTLRRFVENNIQTMTFDNLNKSGRRQKLFNLIFQLLENQEAQVCHRDCLESLRVLSRDKTELNELLTEQKIATLLRLACIYTAVETTVKLGETGNPDMTVAALKVLCNLTYNSTVAVAYVAKSHAAEGILMRLRLYTDPGVPAPIRQFDMKLLFLITALAPEIRHKVKDEYHGLVYLTETLDLILKESDPCSNDNHRVHLTESDVDLCCEIFKVLFNIMCKRVVGDEEEEADSAYLRLTSILHDILLSDTTQDKHLELTKHIVHLLTTLPVSSYSELTTPACPELAKELEFEGRNMSTIEVLVNTLHINLKVSERSKGQLEQLGPIMTVLVQMAQSQRPIRKHLRYRILPPLKDARARPEEGDSIRAHLCRLLTSPYLTIKELSAELLFTLCKKNVGRMIKYTGYGNAAGLFANRGLLLGAARPHSSSSSYSSDSDSETEEYAEVADRINPVTGSYEPNRPNPMEGMSEDQKEYEAIKLVNMIDELERDGIIQPCRIGEDGRPEPIQHILELQEQLPRQQVQQNQNKN